MKSRGRAHSLQLLSLCSSLLSLLLFVGSLLSWKTLETTVSLSFYSGWLWPFDLKALETIENLHTVHSLQVPVELLLSAMTVCD